MKKILFNEDKFNYSFNFKVSIIVSLLICILAFLLYPNLSSEKKEIPYFPEPVITLIDIPNTEQSSRAAPPMPAVPTISSLLNPIDEPEPLPDIKIKETSKYEGAPEGIGKSEQGNATSIYESSALPFIPRQILEVVPEKVEGAEGYIKVRVLIGIDGFVKKHEILNNTTDSQICLKNVVDAVNKSRWQPITIEGEKIEYWIEKTYSFN